MGKGHRVNSTIRLDSVPDPEEGDRALKVGIVSFKHASPLSVAVSVGVVLFEEKVRFLEQAIEVFFRADVILLEKPAVMKKSGKRAYRKCATAKAEEINTIAAGSFST